MSVWAALPDSVGHYVLGRTLGKGSFSLVKEGRDKETNALYAVKIIPKSQILSAQGLERFEREVRVIIKMSHPGIIKVHNFLTNDQFFFLVMEYVSGDTLLSTLSMSQGRSIEFSCVVFKQLIATVAYIHDQGIAHRDLKLENILFDASGHIKIIDFGFSRFANPGEMFATPCGSPVYAAPEVISGHSYDGRAADMWSCGVILYVLVTDSFPWRSTNQAVIYRQILAGDFEFPSSINAFCGDLLRHLMEMEPARRWTAAEALTHPWLDGVDVTWDSGPGLNAELSDRTFMSTLLASQSTQAVSPLVPGQFVVSRANSMKTRNRFAPSARSLLGPGAVRKPGPLVQGSLAGSYGEDG